MAFPICHSFLSVLLVLCAIATALPHTPAPTLRRRQDPANTTGPAEGPADYRYLTLIHDYQTDLIQINPKTKDSIIHGVPSLQFSSSPSNDEVRIRIIYDIGKNNPGGLAVELMDFGPYFTNVISSTGPPRGMRRAEVLDFLTVIDNGALLNVFTGEGIITDLMRRFGTYTVGKGDGINDDSMFMRSLLKELNVALPTHLDANLTDNSAFAANWLPPFSRPLDNIYFSDESGVVRHWRLTAPEGPPELIYDRLQIPQGDAPNAAAGSQPAKRAAEGTDGSGQSEVSSSVPRALSQDNSDIRARAPVGEGANGPAPGLWPFDSLPLPEAYSQPLVVSNLDPYSLPESAPLNFDLGPNPTPRPASPAPLPDLFGGVSFPDVPPNFFNEINRMFGLPGVPDELAGALAAQNTLPSFNLPELFSSDLPPLGSSGLGGSDGLARLQAFLELQNQAPPAQGAEAPFNPGNVADNSNIPEAGRAILAPTPREQVAVRYLEVWGREGQAPVSPFGAGAATGGEAMAGAPRAPVSPWAADAPAIERPRSAMGQTGFDPTPAQSVAWTESFNAANRRHVANMQSFGLSALQNHPARDSLDQFMDWLATSDGANEARAPLAGQGSWGFLESGEYSRAGPVGGGAFDAAGAVVSGEGASGATVDNPQGAAGRPAGAAAEGPEAGAGQQTPEGGAGGSEGRARPLPDNPYLPTCKRARTQRRDLDRRFSCAPPTTFDDLKPGGLRIPVKAQNEITYAAKKGYWTPILTAATPRVLKGLAIIGAAGLAATATIIIASFLGGSYQGKIIGAIGAAASVTAAFLLPAGPIGWVAEAIILVVVTFFGALFEPYKEKPLFDNPQQIVQFRFFGDRDHTGNEKCREEAKKKKDEEDGKNCSNPDLCDPESKCEVHYDSNYIAGVFGWKSYEAVAFMIYFNNGFAMSIPDIAAAFTKSVFHYSTEHREKASEYVAAIDCNNIPPADPKGGEPGHRDRPGSPTGAGGPRTPARKGDTTELCMRANFTLSSHLITIPVINLPADQIFPRLINEKNEGDCDILEDSENGIYLNRYNIKVTGRKVGFACGIKDARYRSMDLVPQIPFGPPENQTFLAAGQYPDGPTEGLAGDENEGFSGANEASTGEAGRDDVAADDRTEFVPLTAENSNCLIGGTNVPHCFPSGNFSAVEGFNFKHLKSLTVAPSGGSFSALTIHDVPPPHKPIDGKWLDWYANMDPATDPQYVESVSKSNFRRVRAWGSKLTVEPPSFCLTSLAGGLGDYWCMGPGGNDLPVERQKWAESVIVRGGAEVTLYTTAYGDKTGLRLTTDTDLSTRTINGVPWSKLAVAAWVRAPRTGV
ncbi:MAG: hypothetical protein M1833_005259 [Piccolia ochrophora]|nr:MAG: hypothetical protein M1833_005259 [Piccolia ochrophora]